MLTKLFSKSSYLANLLGCVFLIIVIIFKIKQNYSSIDIDLSLYQYLGFICLGTFIFFVFGRWEYESMNIRDESTIHVFLFPVAVAFFPKEIFNWNWIFGVVFMYYAFIKFNLFFKNLKENQLLECGIFMSFSIMFIPELFIYLLFLLIAVIITDNFSISKVIALLLPSAITWFLILTINTFSKTNLSFYKWINQKPDFYFQITQGIEGLAFIVVLILAITGFIFNNKINNYGQLQHQIDVVHNISYPYLGPTLYINRLTLIIIHFCFIIFVRTPESLIILIPLIIYGTRNVIKSIRLRVLKECFLWIMLVFSVLNTYLSF